MTRDRIRGWLIIVGLALLATVFFNQSQQIAHIVFGAIGLLFIALLWFFGYSWYRNNLTAISLMPDRQRNLLPSRQVRRPDSSVAANQSGHGYGGGDVGVFHLFASS